MAGEVLVDEGALMVIKGRLVRAVENRPELEERERDPRWDLVRQLVEYKKFKDAALHLEALEARREDIFGRDGADAVLDRDAEVALHDVGLFDLISAFNDALKKVKTEELREIFAERFTVAEKIEVLGDRLRREGKFSLSRMFEGMRSRHEIACTFLALLELIRLAQARAHQRQPVERPFLQDHLGVSIERASRQPRQRRFVGARPADALRHHVRARERPRVLEDRHAVLRPDLP